MPTNKKPEIDISMEILGDALPNRLKKPGHKSVRTTFKLPTAVCAILDRYKQKDKTSYKELIDHIVEFTNNFPEFRDIDFVKRFAEYESGSKGPMLRKSYVTSQKALKTLSDIAARCNLSRDETLQASVLFYEFVVVYVDKKISEKHEKAMKIIDDVSERVGVCEVELGELLDEDDPILSRFGMAAVVLMNLSMAIQSELDSGIQIDPDDITQS